MESCGRRPGQDADTGVLRRWPGAARAVLASAAGSAVTCSAGSGSATACFLDLGDFAAASSAGGGYLVHVLSDQQCLDWLLYLDAAGNEAVLTSTEPIGLDLTNDESAPPRVILLGSDAMDLNVCADAFAEFLHRFWIENEIFFALDDNQPLNLAAASCAARLPRPASRQQRWLRARSARSQPRHRRLRRTAPAARCCR